MNVPWPLISLGKVLQRSERVARVDADRIYREVTVRMNGKGVVERRSVKGIEILSGRRFEAKAGQFIISRIDARHGASGIVPPELDGAVVTNDFPVFDVANDCLDPQYLSWLTKTASFVDLCRRASEGTTNRVRLSEAKFASLTISLPPLGEQQRIVRRIAELTSRVAEAQGLRLAANRETEAMIVSAHFALSSSHPEPLSNFIELHEDEVAIQFGTPYPQVGVRGFGGGLFPKAAVIGGQTTYRAFNRLFEGAVVLSQVKGWEGAVAVTPANLAGYFVSPEYRTFRCKEDRCLPGYLASLARTEFFWGRLKDATRGVGARRERTRPEQFLKLKFAMPDVADQRRALGIFERIRTVQNLQAEISPALNSMLPAILDKAFKGQL